MRGKNPAKNSRQDLLWRRHSQRVILDAASTL